MHAVLGVVAFTRAVFEQDVDDTFGRVPCDDDSAGSTAGYHLVAFTNRFPSHLEEAGHVTVTPFCCTNFACTPRGDPSEGRFSEN